MAFDGVASGVVVADQAGETTGSTAVSVETGVKVALFSTWTLWGSVARVGWQPEMNRVKRKANIKGNFRIRAFLRSAMPDGPQYAAPVSPSGAPLLHVRYTQ